MSQSVDVRSLNAEEGFDAVVEEALGSYVYMLVDPDSKKPFYIGKGGGHNGNDRVLDHFKEARRQLHNPDKSDKKIQRILEIWKREKEVDWFIYKCDELLTYANLAAEIEGVLLKFTEIASPGLLTNKNHGNSGRFYRRYEVLSWGAVNFLPSDVPVEFHARPIMLFNIKNAFARTDNKLDALVRSWRINGKYRKLKDCIAIGIVDGISVICAKVEGWKPSSDSGRYEIVVDGDREIKNIKFWMNKNYKEVIDQVGSWRYGMAGGPLIFQVNKDGLLIFLRGKRDE